jgi:hypothetical protein
MTILVIVDLLFRMAILARSGSGNQSTAKSAIEFVRCSILLLTLDLPVVYLWH